MSTMTSDDIAYELASMIQDEIGDRLHNGEDGEAGFPQFSDSQPGESDNVTVILFEDGRRAFITVEVCDPAPSEQIRRSEPDSGRNS